MIKFITRAIFLTILFVNGQVIAADTLNDTDLTNQLKAEIAGYLTNGDVNSQKFSVDQEKELAQAEMDLAKEYSQQGYRNDAIIFAVQARKILQSIYPNPNDPQLIPIYSLLVQIYSNSYDLYNPGIDASDAIQAKKYREMIDHIHAE